jgi:hypothetical protein
MLARAEDGMEMSPNQAAASDSVIRVLGLGCGRIIHDPGTRVPVAIVSKFPANLEHGERRCPLSTSTSTLETRLWGK